jgi:hypothetical protein
MAQQQQVRRPAKSSKLGEVVQLILVCALIVLGVYMLVRLLGNPDLTVVLDQVGLSKAAPILTWSGWKPLLIILATAAVLIFGGRLAVIRILRIRGAARQRLAKSLGRVLPEDWDPNKHLRVRRWRRLFTPRKVTVYLTPACADRHPDFRTAVTRALTEQLTSVKPIRWPDPAKDHRRLLRPELRRIVVESGTGVDDTDASDIDQNTRTIETLTGALNGLVPRPEPEIKINEDGKRIITIRYGETTRDQSAHWRARVVDQIQARLGEHVRDEWDRKQRAVQLSPIPDLPKLLDWAEEQAKIREEAPGLARWAVPYGTDEDGRVVYWEPGDSEPHALVVGETGSGKTETMKTIAACWLTLGGLLAISDKKKGWGEFLGKPGVLAVCTDDADRVGLLADLRSEVYRRTAAKDLKEIYTQDPGLATDLPEAAGFDDIPILFIQDELTVHQKGVQDWWSNLPKEIRERDWGRTTSTAPMLGWPAEIVMVARAPRIHCMFGMQRPDAANFGDSTAMRENLAHMISMARLKPIGSDQMWGDRRIGVDVEIRSKGEGLSNGPRLDGPNRMFPPGRFKAWYLGKLLQDPEFWERVAEVAPPTGFVQLGHVSDAARDPKAAAEKLREIAYGHFNPPTGDIPSLASCDVVAINQKRPDVAPPDEPAAKEPAASTPPPDAPTPGDAAVDVEGIRRLVVDQPDDVDAVDDDGAAWKNTAVTDIEPGQVIQVGDIASAEVVEVPGWCVDEFDDSEVFRLVIDAGDGEQTVDLNGEELILRREDAA